MADDSRRNRVEIEASEPKSRPVANEDPLGARSTMTLGESVSYVGSTEDHVTFLTAVFTVSVCMLLVTVLQWYFLLKIDLLLRLVKAYHYMTMLLIFVCFIMFLNYIYCFNSIISIYRSSFTRYALTVIVVELSGLIIIHPLSTYKDKHDVLFSMIITCTLPILSYIISIKAQVEFGFASDFIMLWTMRYYFISYMGIRIVMAVDNTYGEIWFSVFGMLFIILFILLVGLTLGNKAFFVRESPNVFLFSMLSYLNYLTMFANTLLLLQNLREIENYIF